MTCNLTTSPLQCKVLICLSHLQSPFTWISLHWRKGAQFPKNRCLVLFKAFGSLRCPHRAGGYWTGLAEGSWSSRCWRPAGIPQSISDGVGHRRLGKWIMALNHHDQPGGKRSDSPSKKTENFQIAPAYTYEGLTMPSIQLPSQLGGRNSNHSICLLAYSM